jgi:protein N-terminal methyltransferase
LGLVPSDNDSLEWTVWLPSNGDWSISCFLSDADRFEEAPVYDMYEDDDNLEVRNPAEVFEEYKDSWYTMSSAYWARQEPTTDGMLGGFRHLTGFDVLTSRDLIQKYQNPPPARSKFRLGNRTVADCGCGVGRVSHFVLSDYFSEIDLVDPVESFIDVAIKTVAKDGVKVRKIVTGAQDWHPDRLYDAFWIQWVIMYLTDVDAVAFLQRCKAHLNPNGLIFLKDNLASSDLKSKKEEAQFFVEDRGVCRAHIHYLEIIKLAGLTVVEGFKQDQWPDDMLPLFCFVLK